MNKKGDFCTDKTNTKALFPPFVLNELLIHWAIHHYWQISLLIQAYRKRSLCLQKYCGGVYLLLLLSDPNFFKLKLFVAYFRRTDTKLNFIFPFKFLYPNKTKQVYSVSCFHKHEFCHYALLHDRL